MIKQIIFLCVLFCCVNVATAGEIVTEDNDKVYIYGGIEETVYMSRFNDNETNYNRTLCINATCIEGEISICGHDDYELEYQFIADINDDDYIMRILTIKQEVLHTGFLSKIELQRNLTLDGVLIGSYITTTAYFGIAKKNTVYFNLIDDNIRFGSDIIINESLAFTQLNYVDQQIYLVTTRVIKSSPISHKYITIGSDGDMALKLSGLTGIIYNVLGMIPKVGDSLQAAMFMPLSIIQFTFNLLFTFLILMANNWWYALMTIEIMCIIPALKYHSFSTMVDKYISKHVSIFKFIYEVIILNVFNLILRIIEIIRNMFRI